MVDDLRVSVYDDDLQVVVDAAFALNGSDGVGVQAGGLTGQILTKKSGVDYDTLWKDPTAGVPVDGTAGQLLSKVSSTPYDTLWVDPPVTDLSNYPQLDAANVFTANNTFASIVMPEAAPIYMGSATDGYVTLQHQDGGLAVISPRWGASLRVYGVGIEDLSAITNGQVLVIQHDTIDSFFINTHKYGTSPEARLWIQGWNLGSASDPHLVAWNDNTQDIGVLAASPYKGRIRNIYAGTGLYEAGVALSAKYLALAGGAVTGAVSFAVSPTAPTPTGGDNTTKLATTAFVTSAVSTSGGAYLPLTGGTLSGALIVNAPVTSGALEVLNNNLHINRAGNASSALLLISSDPGTPATIYFRNSSAMQRWQIGKGIAAETGGNTGSDFSIVGYSDTNTNLGAYLLISRSTKIAAFTATPTAPTASPGDNTTKLATTAFVTAAVAAGGGGALDATLVALAALDATAGYVEQTGVDTFTKRATNAFAYLATPNVFTAAQTINSGTLTTSQPLTIAQTWSNSATVFDALKINLVAGDAGVNWDFGSALIKGVVDGVEVFNVSPYGEIWSLTGGFYTTDFGVVATFSGGTVASYGAYNSSWYCRWLINLFGAETGSNTGGNFSIEMYADNGDTLLHTPLTITRATGVTNFSTTPTVAGVALSTTYARLAVANTFTAAQTIASGTITTSQPALSVTQQWNAAGVTFTGIFENITDTASAAASQLIDLQVGGATKFRVDKTGKITTVNPSSGWLILGTDIQIVNGNGGRTIDLYGSAGGITNIVANTEARLGFSLTASNTAPDTGLVREGSGILSQRSGVIAQMHRVYNTYTDASNYERARFGWVSGDLQLGTEVLGTGAATRQLHIFGHGGIRIYTGSTITFRWNFDTAGHFMANADNTYDIGAAAASRPRNVYVGTAIYEAGATLASKYAALAAAAFTGAVSFAVSPTAPTPTAGDDTTKVATTAFVKAAVTAGGGGGGQPLDATLTAFAAITGAADQFPYFTAADVFSTATITSAARTVLDDTTVAAMLATMGGAPLASPTFTGTLTAFNITSTGIVTNTGSGFMVDRGGANSDANMFMVADNGYVNYIYMHTGSSGPTGKRWVFGKNFDSEAGSNAGSNFILQAYSDTGSSLGQVFNVARATRITNFLFMPTVAGVSLSTTFQPAGSYAAATHTHAIADVTGLQAALDAKELLGEVAGVNTQASSYTLVLADKGKVVEMNNASANNLTIPLNSSVAFPLNTRIDISQIGAGQTTIVPTGGVTIRQRETKLKLAGQYAGASLYKRATDEWVLFGDLST